MNDPLVPETFRLSQQALEDYTACPYRFYLRYLRRLRWPTPPQDEEVRLAHLRRGARFHRLVQRHLLGLPAEPLQQEAESDPDLARWWEHYRHQSPVELDEGRRYVEQVLTATLDGMRLIARYDLILLHADGSALIVDWKSSARAEDVGTLRRRWQTRLYRYLLVRAGAALNGGHPIPAEKVTMLYWYAPIPAERRLPYSDNDFARDEADLRRIIAELSTARAEPDFPRTTQERHCRFCPYRTYCFSAAPYAVPEAEAEEQDLDSWDFEQIAEIAF